MAVRVKETTFDNYAYHQVGYLHPEVIGSGKRRVPKLLAIGGRDEPARTLLFSLSMTSSDRPIPDLLSMET